MQTQMKQLVGGQVARALGEYSSSNLGARTHLVPVIRSSRTSRDASACRENNVIEQEF